MTPREALSLTRGITSYIEPRFEFLVLRRTPSEELSSFILEAESVFGHSIVHARGTREAVMRKAEGRNRCGR